MIIYVLIFLAILFFLSWNLFMSSRKLHVVTSTIATILLLVAIIFSIENFNHHYGMYLANHSGKIYKITSISERTPMLIYEKIGSAKKHELVIYKNANHNKCHTDPDTSVTNKIIQTNVKHPVLKVVHRDWQYRSSAMRLWFSLAQKRQRYSTVNYFYIPKQWNVLSINQVKVMGKMAKQAQKKLASPQIKTVLKQKAQAFVKGKVTNTMRKDPRMTASHRKAIAKQAKQTFRTKAKIQAEAKIMPKVLKSAKRSPEGYIK